MPFVALSAHNVRYRYEAVEAFIAGRIGAPMYSVMTANRVRNVMSRMLDWSIQQTRYGAVVVANPVRPTRRADQPDTVYFELDAVQVKHILHLIRDVWPERHRARYPVGRRTYYKLLANLHPHHARYL